MRRSSRTALILLAALLAIGAPFTAGAAPTEPSPEVARLLDLVEHRARLMPDVARWKWHAGRAVSDPARERAVLAAATRTAAAAGLEVTGARAFVDAQMRVSRAIQTRAFENYAEAPPPENGPDLQRDLRPAISATTDAVLEVLPRVLPLLPASADALRRSLRERLAPIGADAESIEVLATALLALRPATLPAARLERILARGTLRVATTGDYAPFSAVDASGERQGIDVDLARALAASLGVEVAWVETSWPTLMTDLAAGRFDVAMSGISRTLERARSGDFSAPYHVGGKTPVVRCADSPRFDSLAAIDAPGVRAVVNPGGTNERFARARLEQASLHVFPDNRRIFDEIAEGRADVMFTDAIEVRRVTRDDARLCAALPGTMLTYQEKGFLLPRDDDGAWLRYVDLWLAQLRGDGRLAAAFARHLDARSGN